MTEETLGERIARLRDKQRITQEEMEAKSGIARRTIQNIEGSKTQDPGVFAIAAIAKVLDVSLDEVVFGRKTADKRSAGELSPSELAEALALKLTKPEPTGNRAKLHALVDRLSDDDAGRFIKTLDAFFVESKKLEGKNRRGTGS
jgi:transcriptional regulator with XRE-family HTH domain